VAVNPRYREVLGVPCYPSLRELPSPPEAVIVAVSAKSAPAVVEEAAAVGARAAVVFAMGFAEAGCEGRARQEQIVRTAAASGMVVLGPNCQGLINFWDAVPLYMEAVEPYEPGCVALISQSGSMTTSLLNSRVGVRWGYIVSTGNEAVVNCADLIRYCVDAPRVSVICAFLETIREPSAFFTACDRARAAGKPVIVLKSGRSERAREAVRTHSGALSPPDRLVDELFQRHGVLRADSLEELLAMALVAQGRRPLGRRLATLAASGGQIEVVLDEAAKVGMEHPSLSQQTRERLQALLPDFLPASNPLDFWGAGDLATTYPQLLRAVAEDENVDIVVTLVSDLSNSPTYHPGSLGSRLEAAAAVAASVAKPLVVLDPVFGDPPPEVVEQLLARGVLLLSGMSVAFKALSAMATFAVPSASREASPRLDMDRVGALLSSVRASSLAGTGALELFRTAGIPVPPGIVVTSEDEANDAALRIGYPVVLKVDDGAILHKTDVGGVALSLTDERAVREAFRALRARGFRQMLVQRQLRDGVELIVGLQTDDTLGTFVLVGLGGIWTEVLDDIAIRPVNLRPGEAAEMLQELHGYPLLLGGRTGHRADLAALETVIERVAALGVRFGACITSLDINPLLVTHDGAYAVDGIVERASGC
jgi:acyl-CoA synthetase (NDP forming)